MSNEYDLSADDLSAFPRPNLAVDLILMTIENDELHILMLERDRAPFKGLLALPGGFVHPGERLDDCAYRVLSDKAHLVEVPVEQLYSFSEPKRDPRGWVVSVAYLALVPFAKLEDAAGSDEGLALVRVNRDPTNGVTTLIHGMARAELAFDHEAMIRTAVERLRGKLDWSMVAFGLLPERFTLYELQRVHEVILGRRLNKNFFRKKMLAQRFANGSRLFATGLVTSGRSHRPAELFELRKEAEGQEAEQAD
jgi:8-oxo-dGTP diphosphatase